MSDYLTSVLVYINIVFSIITCRQQKSVADIILLSISAYEILEGKVCL